MRLTLFLLVLALGTAPSALAELAGFEDTSPSLAAESFYNGAPTEGFETITSDTAGFNNTYSASFGGFWSGWSYSNVYDITTYGIGNQYAAYTDTGSAGAAGSGSATYGVGYDGSPFGLNPEVTFSSSVLASSIDITNTTYVYHAVVSGIDSADGSTSFVKGPFELAADDLLTLTITGSLGGSTTGTVDVLLADYTGASASVISDWTSVDLTSLGTIDKLSFTMTTTDTSGGFANTPLYFAADNLSFAPVAVPEPGSIWLLALVGGLAVRRRGRGVDEPVPEDEPAAA